MLADADIPITDFALSVLKAWQLSTPLEPWTNNPLGMPYVKGVNAPLLSTGYALFVSLEQSRKAFTAFLNSQSGRKVRDALAVTEKYSVAYRAINDLRWPAKNTETDWPSAVLDMVLQPIRDRLASVTDPSLRKTSGTVFQSPDPAGAVRGSRRATQNSASTMSDASRAIWSAVRRASNG